jgi:hypothetical protein
VIRKGDKKKSQEQERRLIGYRVITQSLLVGSKVFKKGEFITLEDAKKELDYVEGFNLVEAVYDDDEDEPESLGETVRKSISSTFAFRKLP